MLAISLKHVVERPMLPPPGIDFIIDILVANIGGQSIAAAVGLHEAFYFSRPFRDRENCSPSESDRATTASERWIVGLSLGNRLTFFGMDRPTAT
ncbi:hypothetical protein [Mesorhizobium sp. ArgA1]